VKLRRKSAAPACPPPASSSGSERDVGKPVVTSQAATLWHALRTAGITGRVTGCGRLLSDLQ
jgi:maleate cis-trans isomerase